MIKKRIASVDLLRGFTIALMILVNTPGTWGSVYPFLLHAKWHGLTPTDLVFPFFLFIVGISIYFAYKSSEKSKITYKKIAIRSLKLFGLGFFLNIALPYFPFLKDFETVRFLGVLQRIAIVFFISSILFLNFNWKMLLGIGITILIAYWLVLGFLPFSDGTLPTFDRAPNNWANYIDLNILGKHMWEVDYDPEGLFSTLPSVVTCISGILIGKILDLNKIKYLFLSAFILLCSGLVFSIWFPINKAIWSSSFVLVTSGWASLILAIIYYLRDIKQFQFGTVFKYMGMNAITIYFLSSFISNSMYSIKVGANHNIHNYIYENIFVHPFLSDNFSSFLYGFFVVLFYLGLGYMMFKKKIFLKV